MKHYIHKAKVTFKAHVYAPPFAPYYDAYKGHVFVIDHRHPEPEATDHVWLECIDDPSVKVQGYVELDDLAEET